MSHAVVSLRTIGGRHKVAIEPNGCKGTWRAQRFTIPKQAEFQFLPAYKCKKIVLRLLMFFGCLFFHKTRNGFIPWTVEHPLPSSSPEACLLGAKGFSPASDVAGLRSNSRCSRSLER
eukprot:s1781_g5.t1